MNHEELECYLESLSVKEAEPDKSLEHQELLQFIRKTVGELDPLDKKVVVLKYWKKLSLQSIGGRLGCTKEELIVIEKRAMGALKMKIRRFVEENGYEL